METILPETEESFVNLAVPNPPPTVKYPDLEDWQHKMLLELNGVALNADAIARVLERGAEVLQVSAAHTAGSMGFSETIPLLEKISKAGDDLVQVEAAYALVRLGSENARAVLEKCLTYPLDAYLSPSAAAGYLARLGDARGFSVIMSALQQPLSIIRMMACKQLYFFAPFHGTRANDQDTLHVFAQFERALNDADREIQWQAIAQLRELDAEPARALLQRFAANTSDDRLRRAAQAVHEGHQGR